MSQDAQQVCSECVSCQMDKNKNVSSKVPLKVFDVPEKPFEMITMDFVGPLPESAGYDTVLVVVDKFTKYMTAIPVNKEMDAAGLLEVLNKEVFLRFSLPKRLISDRGVLFTSNEFKDWC